MYTELRSYQIIISLLKKYGISRCVLSAGSRNVPFVHSVETDSYFNCYSVVDERSAGYFAIGLSQQLNEPVVISCTASTASCNYYPPVSEAFYQKVPIVILTSDRDPSRLHQWEDQMIDQVGMFERHTVKSVNLPVIHGHDDEIWCRRLVNEALSELYHNGGGPVHINIPMVGYNTSFTVKELPDIPKIDRISHETPSDIWNGYFEKLKKARRILVTPGQSSSVSDELKTALERFFKKYNAAICVDYMSNMDIEHAINTSLCFDNRNITARAFGEYIPDIVISFGGNIFQGLKEFLIKYCGKFEHWSIQPDGKIVDIFKSISAVFECSPEYFFERCSDAAGDSVNGMEYSDLIKKFADSFALPEDSFSNVYAVKKTVERINSGSILHLAINNAIRITNYCKLRPHIKVYANIGTYGIDGCMSTFFGQACASDAPSFLVIGDLAYFYDMNSMRIRHIGNNVRILLINNGGGGEFYYNKTWMSPTGDLHTSARHHTKAEGWVREAGFKYLSASDKESFDAALDEFMVEKSDLPILFEVFTEMSTDAKTLHDYYESNMTGTDKIYHNAKQFAKDVIGQEKARKILNMMKNNSSKNRGGGVITDKHRRDTLSESIVNLCGTPYAQAMKLDSAAA